MGTKQNEINRVQKHIGHTRNMMDTAQKIIDPFLDAMYIMPYHTVKFFEYSAKK